MTGPELAREALRLTQDALAGKDSTKDMPQLSDAHRERNLQAALIYSNLAQTSALVEAQHAGHGMAPRAAEWDKVFSH